MQVGNGIWGVLNLAPLLFFTLIMLTIGIETGLIYWYGKRKGYTNLGQLTILVVVGNFITSIFGILLATVEWLV